MKRETVRSVALHAVSFAAILAIGWFAHQLFGPAALVSARKPPAMPSVRVAEVTPFVFNPVSEYVGHVEAAEVTDILPQVDGYIRRVCFTEGAYVARGEMLFEIDVEQYEAARNLRYSEVRSAEAKVLVAQSELELAERYYQRLSSADDRGITAKELDSAKSALASAKAALNSANAAVEQAKASAAIADFNLKHTKVNSPISGRIGRALHHVGDYVSPSKSALARVVRLDPIRVVFPITDKDYDEWQQAAEYGGETLKDAVRLRVRMPSGELYEHSGEIAFGDNEIDRRTGTLTMYVDFPNPNGRLVPGAFVRILKDGVSVCEQPAVPATAVEVTDEGRRVWTVDAENRVHPVAVEIGETWQGMTRIVDGVETGVRVVSVGAFKLRDGMSVKVIE